MNIVKEIEKVIGLEVRVLSKKGKKITLEILENDQSYGRPKLIKLSPKSIDSSMFRDGFQYNKWNGTCDKDIAVIYLKYFGKYDELQNYSIDSFDNLIKSAKSIIGRDIKYKSFLVKLNITAELSKKAPSLL